MLHDKERQLEVEIKSRKEASNSNQQVNEKIYSLEKVVSLKRENEIKDRESEDIKFLNPWKLRNQYLCPMETKTRNWISFIKLSKVVEIIVIRTDWYVYSM